MGVQGRNKGVTGLLDLMPLGVGGVTFPPLQVQAVGFGAALTATPVKITGPGDGKTEKFYGALPIGGQIEVHGKVQSAQSPFPPTMCNLQGTVTLQADTNCTLAVPVLLTEVSVTRDTEAQDTWNIDGKGVKNGLHVPLWNGQSVSYTQPTLAIHEVNAGSVRIDDPNSLTTAAQTHLFFPTMNGTNSAYSDSDTATLIAAYLATATPPRTGLKVHTSQAIRIDDDAVMLLLDWKLRDSADDTLFPHTSSRRSSTEPFTDRVGSITSSSSSVATVANAAWAAFQGTAYAKGVEVLPLIDGKKLVVYNYWNPGYVVKGQARSGARQIAARMSGTDPQLYVQNIFQYTGTAGVSGRALLILSLVLDYSADIRDFIVFRNFVGSAFPENSASSIGGHALPNIGQINSDTFLGLPAKTVAYQGLTFKTNLGLASNGNFSMFVGWKFHANSLGIIDGVPGNIFNRRLVQQVTGFTTGWRKASELGFPSIAQPSSASFVAFTS